MFDYFTKYLIEMRYGGISAVLSQILTIFCVVGIANEVNFTWKGLLKIAVHAVVGFFTVLLLSSVTHYIINLFTVNEWPFILLFWTLAGSIFYLAFHSKHKPKVSMIYLSVFFAAIIVKNLIITTLSGLIRWNLLNGAVDEWIISFSIELITIIGCTAFIKLLPLNKVGHIQTFSAVFVAIITLLSYGLMELERSVHGDLSDGMKLLMAYVSIVFFAFDLLFYFQLRKSALEYSSKIELLALRRKDELNNEFFRISQANLDEMHRIRHDIKNQFLYMNVLFENKDYKGLAKYFSDLNNYAIIPLSFSDSGNKVVSAILYIERGKARASGIDIESKLVIPEKVAIDDLDLNALLMNLIDNAIDACAADEIENAVIELFMRQQDSYLYITIKNPVKETIDPAERLKLVSNKRDTGHVHGYGSKIVATIVKKYDGIIKYNINDGIFSVDVMLTLKNAGAEDEANNKN